MIMIMTGYGIGYQRPIQSTGQAYSYSSSLPAVWWPWTHPGPV